ncbi:hypothetical protein HU200_008404 [Digitaria exilis]|uniref:Myotrophin n=1 Tax=Digitaria exilis TaxID=1010633 RepID=A0A835FL83_9POAL|nr:hypothetical protein HU200_008404 [Digitaria exilis]
MRRKQGVVGVGGPVCTYWHYEAVRLLLSKGVDVDPVNHRGTPLHLAAAKDRDQVVKILLEHGADPDRVVNHIFSPLMMACCGQVIEMCEATG